MINYKRNPPKKQTKNKQKSKKVKKVHAKIQGAALNDNQVVDITQGI